MRNWDSKFVSDIIWLQDTIEFQDIYKIRNDKRLVHSMGIWDTKCVCDVIWLQDTL